MIQLEAQKEKSQLQIKGVRQVDKLAYLNAYAIDYTSKTGKDEVWEIVSRGKLERLQQEVFEHRSFCDGSVIFATNAEHTQVVLLREFRVGAGKYVYMLPAGLTDPGEAIEVTAVREFYEETGLVLEPILVEPARYISIGIVNEKASLVFGYFSGVPSTAHQADHEDAEIVIADRKEAMRILAEEEVTFRTATLLQDFFNLNSFFKTGFTK